MVYISLGGEAQRSALAEHAAAAPVVAAPRLWRRRAAARRRRTNPRARRAAAAAAAGIDQRPRRLYDIHAVRVRQDLDREVVEVPDADAHQW